MQNPTIEAILQRRWSEIASVKNSIRGLICFLLLLAGGGLNAQNLEFVDARMVDSKTDTVPTGRIWKVESIVYSQGVTLCPTSSNYINISDSITLNGKGMMVRAQRFSGLHPGWSSQAFSPEFIVWEQKLPMWLPSKTTVAAGRGVMYLSVLEFKKTP
ncbi:MAG: hypothetical protein RIT07_1432 [Bacteroidota bacterium]